jgi:hypothetical protein
MKGILVGLITNRRWPLHPRPSEWEDLATWVRRIAEAYGVSYDAFLLNALDHTGRGRPMASSPNYQPARESRSNGYRT